MSKTPITVVNTWGQYQRQMANAQWQVAELVKEIEARYPGGTWFQDEYVVTPENAVMAKVVFDYSEHSELDEVAANMDLTGLKTWADCKALAKRQMPDETGQVLDNLADALMSRVRKLLP